MYLGRSAPIDIEIDSKGLETFVDDFMIFINYILRRAALLTRFNGNWYAMFVGAANIQHIFTPEPEVAHINVGRHIHTCQMSYMNGTVGIRQRAGYKGSLEFLFHLYSSCFNFSFSFFCLFCKAVISSITGRFSSSERPSIDFRSS